MTKITMQVEGKRLGPLTKIIGALILKLGGEIVITEEEMQSIKGIYFDQPIKDGPTTMIAQKKGE